MAVASEFPERLSRERRSAIAKLTKPLLIRMTELGSGAPPIGALTGAKDVTV